MTTPRLSISTFHIYSFLHESFGLDRFRSWRIGPRQSISVRPKGEYQIQAEIADVKKEDVIITLENGVLTLQGQRRHENEEQGKKFHRIERSYGRFARTFSLSDVIDNEKEKAEFKDGVLNLHLPKSEKAKPKSIEVTVA